MKIAVIGGGVAGLSTAYYIQKNLTKDVDIYEKSSDIGGLAGVFKLGDTLIEKYYHHVFTHDKYLMELIREIKLEDSLIWRKTKMGYYCKGKSYPFATPVDIMRFTPLKFIDRIKLGASSLLISRHKYNDEMENITAEDYLIKYAGKEGWDKFWKPMMKIKFGENFNKIPAVWIWERIVQRVRSRTKGAKDEVLGYMEGSFYTLLKKLADVVQENGAKLHLNAGLEEIVVENGVCKGIKANNEVKNYDYVVFTPALQHFVDVCRNAPEDYIAPLRVVKYDCAMIMVMVLKEKLSDFYWLNVADDEIPFGGLIEHTNFIPKEVYGGKVVLYFSKYLNVNSEYLKMSDEEVKNIYVEHLRKIYPDFNEKIIEKYMVFKDRYAQPIWPMNYSKIKPAYKTPIKNLYMANTSQIYPNDRGINFSIKLGKEVVECMENDIKEAL
ncbi:MAG TPA: NAD(P)/FAD-dependent oxidoreductase [Pseudobacteroides sp.]|uniref:NAD(P)/FAD-dependent oxidoreductase n=1 Tax=Pseudobacteroides sp. TaxID=1968840 RepID=UPI002F9396A4